MSGKRWEAIPLSLSSLLVALVAASLLLVVQQAWISIIFALCLMLLFHPAGASARFGFPLCVRYLASISPSWSALLLFCGSLEGR